MRSGVLERAINRYKYEGRCGWALIFGRVLAGYINAHRKIFSGSKGDSYDNALAETIIGLYKTEVIRRRGPWKNIDDVELATLEWIDWFNNRRLLEPIGDIPPAEYEMLYWTEFNRTDTVGLTELSLH